VESNLQAGRESLHQVGVAVSCKKYQLKKGEADCPDAGRAAKPRHDLFGNDGLNEEKQKARQPNSQRVDQDGPLPGFLGVEALGQRESNMFLCAGQPAYRNSPHGLDGRDKPLHQRLGGRGTRGDPHP